MRGESVRLSKGCAALGGSRSVSRRAGGVRMIQAGICIFMAVYWLICVPTPLFSQNAPQSTRGKAIAGSSAEPRTRSANSPSTATASGHGRNIGSMLQLGALGGNWVRIFVAKLRGETAQVNATTDNNQVSHLTMVGLIRIESEKLNLECENLKYDISSAGRILEARYNVHVDLRERGIKADCGLLVYDLDKNVITLTVDPYVQQTTADGQGEIKNMKEIILTLKPGNQCEISMKGDQAWMDYNPRGAKTGATKSADHSTTPGAPREITPENLGAAAGSKTATPTPNPLKK